MSSVFESFLSTAEMQQAWGEREFVSAMLRFEAALARAQAQVGLMPQACAQSIIGTCKVELFDVARIVRDSARAGSLAIPLVKSLKETVGLFNPQAVEHVHLGSTSQDVIDTAVALIAQPALALIDADLQLAIDALLALAERHADDPVLARTLMQPASVTSFGFKCMGWAAPLLRSRQRLQAAGEQGLCLQLGGAVGTMAQMGGHGPEVARLMAAELGLRCPEVAWHTQRDLWVVLGCELAVLVGSLGKVAKDVSLMGQFEVGEVAEPTEAGRGGSSAMPHKRNPVACMVSLAAATRAPQRAAALLASMVQEHERALGSWQAELAESAGLMMGAHAAVRAMAQTLAGLQVDVPRMRANIEQVRRALPPQAAQEWFDPGLARFAAQSVRAQLQTWRSRSDVAGAPATSGA
jgi:3-carboxy-cis,cis-muconate cycloisomerase